MKNIKKTDNWLLIHRHVRFGDVDSAGVIHFHNLFRWAHEAWEESLTLYGLSLNEVFPSPKQRKNHDVALPIVHCEANFYLPIHIGDNLKIELFPQKLDEGSFQVEFKFKRDKEEVALSILKHRAINYQSRYRCDLPKNIATWLELSLLKLEITPE